MPSRTDRTALKIQGMDCADEAAILKREIGPLVGGEQFLTFDILNGVMTVLPGDRGSIADIVAAVNQTGMRAEEQRAKSDAPKEKPSWWSRNGRLSLTAASGVLTAAGFALHYLQAGGLAGVLGSEGMGIAAEVPWQARVPYLLRVLVNGETSKTPPGQVPVGTPFQVRPGERIPLDGEVTRGVSDVNQAPITGESAPVPKEPGSAVFAGTVNGGGSLETRSTKASGDRTLAQIIRMVGDAQDSRPPSEQ